ncbi:MAG: winged helix-turn-helix domain-containing protein [Candidatus Heteroscillospira sp.]|jgi:two-component system alkaline phosphatase synthesis response regulator PhoP
MIYFVEDDNSIRKLVLYTLTSQGLECEGFSRPGEFWEAMEKRLPDLVMLDIMLPEEDGISILRRLRGASDTKKLQIIMLTAKGSEYDKVIGLDSGADDYIAKPFGMMELVARIKTALRRVDTQQGSGQSYELGCLRVNPVAHTVTVSGQSVTLTLKEYELLCLLLERRGAVFTRDQLLNTIWGYSFDGASRTVDVHVRTLRQKLGEAGVYIQTVRGVGYKIGEAAQ